MFGNRMKDGQKVFIGEPEDPGSSDHVALTEYVVDGKKQSSTHFDYVLVQCPRRRLLASNSFYVEGDLIILEDKKLAFKKEDFHLKSIKKWPRDSLVPKIESGKWALHIDARDTEKYENAQRDYAWFSKNSVPLNRKIASRFQYIALILAAFGIWISIVIELGWIG